MEAATGGVRALGQSDFLALLVAQLKNQDPLDPVKDTDFIAQLAQFSTLQSVQTLNASFDQTLKLQQLTGGTALLGRAVQYSTGGVSLTTGKVGGVKVQNGSVFLQVGSTAVPLDSVVSVLPA